MSSSAIESLKQEIDSLKDVLAKKEAQLSFLINQQHSKFTSEEISRYSRQMIIPQITKDGQIALKNSNVLIVGAGGLGCPAALYLTAAGIGELTIVDNDEVDLTNLHRQILHTQADLGVPKVESAYNKLNSINANVKVTPIKTHVNSSTISSILNKTRFDMVIDGSDNVVTRYLLNDVCVFYGLPLVSGSALQLEGQLTVYNHKGGPCYRCLFPTPPPPETVTSCGDGGVLGPVPGTIGVLQALEAIKIIVGLPGVLSGRLLLFDGSNTTFRNVTLRAKNKNCYVCGENPVITDLIDYEEFCRAKAHDKVVDINILSVNDCIPVESLLNKNGNCILIDVRPKLEFSMCKLPNFVNVPLVDIEKRENLDELKELVSSNRFDTGYVLCRRGNDSQKAVYLLKEMFPASGIKFLNITGGLHAYAKKIDSSFPMY